MVAVGAVLTTVFLYFTAIAARSTHSRSPYAIREKHVVPKAWQRIGPAPADAVIDLRIALKQSRFDELEAHLFQVSNPAHRRYGQHLSGEQVRQLVKPSQETSVLVHEWLADYGYSGNRLDYSSAKDWIKLALPVCEAEKLLDTKYSLYKHLDGSTLIRTPNWSIPANLHEHINAVQPTNSFFRTSPKRSTWMAPPNMLKAPVLSEDQAAANAALAKTLAAAPNTDALKVCNATSVTTDCLRTLYNTKGYTPKIPARSKIGFCNYLEETTIMTDLDQFVSKYRSDAKGANIKFEIVNNGENLQTLTQEKLSKGADTEANLDGQTIVGITYPIPVTAYNVGGRPPITGVYAPPPGQMNTNEPYLDWVQYMLAKSDGDIPPVISTSYGEDEASVPKDYAIRTCQDFAQLGTRGVTLLFSSGDSGVGNPAVGDGQCEIFPNPDKPENGMPNFLPSFPASCPYVTAVGGTRGLPQSGDRTGNFNVEVAAGYPSGISKYASGGGFSNYFTQPTWQKDIVNQYVSQLTREEVDPNMFNKTGRAYPDLAANGQQYAVIWNGRTIAVDGTSASSPTMGAVIALLNDDLMANGQSPLGFMNPWLYTTGKDGFMDIKSGSASGCNVAGFPAKEGWDAVTGFGTPNFVALQKLAKKAGDPERGFIDRGPQNGPGGGWRWGGRYF
ncbi:subtilisin-like protein [Tothia fuscella]|uniref:tripeptidyl-peptidase II n=1 Tax=Tothia fuscella TaxID=1048955 RepID=A0A9P4NLS4_9PEZI|nr:subtilisin-like protein [Tothia fuscella]